MRGRSRSPGAGGEHHRRWWLPVVVFILFGHFLSSSFSWPQIAGVAGERRVVTHLPGFQGPLPFSLQTGYVEVDERHGVRLFYYFIPSERSPADDPVLLWLSGGPGCSAFTALVYQIGPLRFDLHGHTHTHTDDGGLPKLVYTSESWTKVSSIIFLDSPVGAGFSYAVTEQGYATSDTRAVNHILIFLTKWFDEHPEFLSNPLYIGGDSYAGIIVPTVTSAIASGKLTASELALNLKGYIVGNPVTDANFDNPSRIPFSHGMGLISDEIYEAYKKSCDVGYSSHRSVQCTNSLEAIDERLKDIFLFHILEPLCPDDESPHPYNSVLKMKLNSGVRDDYAAEEPHLSYISTKCRVPLYRCSRLWANDDTVREALGVHMGTVPSWVRCNNTVALLHSYDIPSAVKYHLDVTTKGYRSLVYSGDHDMLIPYIGTQSWIRSLNSSNVDDWRPWYVEGQVAGYRTSYSNNLTFATVKGAGHTGPEYMPKQCLAMFARWLAGEPL